MKRKLLMMMLILTMAVSLTACGKSKEEKEMEQLAEDLGLSKRELKALQEDFGMSEDSGKQEQPQEKKETSKEREARIIAEFKKYDAASEWKDANFEYGAVQIDDTLYIPGGTIDDLMKQVEKSDVKYEFEYNPDKMTEKNAEETIKVYREEIEWFHIDCKNFTEDMISLKDAVVTAIRPTYKAETQVRIIDGRTTEDFIGYTYDEVQDLMETVIPLEGWEISESTDYYTDKDGNDVEVFVETIYSVENSYGEIEYPNPLLLHTGYDVRSDLSFVFYVSKDTGKVIDVNYNYYSVSIHESEPIEFTSLSEIEDEHWRTLIEECNVYLTEEKDAVSIEGLQVYYGTKDERSDVALAFKLQQSDGTEKYALIEFIQVGEKPSGEVRYIDSYGAIGDVEEGPLELENSWSREVLESMPFPEGF